MALEGLFLMPWWLNAFTSPEFDVDPSHDEWSDKENENGTKSREPIRTIRRVRALRFGGPS